MNDFTYGICPRCGAYLSPELFLEEEERGGIKTGRKRWSVSYLQCEECDYRTVVDDSYDGQWFV